MSLGVPSICNLPHGDKSVATAEVSRMSATQKSRHCLCHVKTGYSSVMCILSSTTGLGVSTRKRPGYSHTTLRWENLHKHAFSFPAVKSQTYNNLIFGLCRLRGFVSGGLHIKLNYLGFFNIHRHCTAHQSHHILSQLTSNHSAWIELPTLGSVADTKSMIHYAGYKDKMLCQMCCMQYITVFSREGFAASLFWCNTIISELTDVLKLHFRSFQKKKKLKLNIFTLSACSSSSTIPSCCVDALTIEKFNPPTKQFGRNQN